jgi:hypothetical protein
MKRRFNYTNRKRIARENVKILLKPQKDIPSFDAQVQLDDLKLPATSKVYVEAQYRNSFMRFDFGTVADPRSSEDRTLREIDNRELVSFRVKVVDPTGEHGKVLAEIDGVSPAAEGPGARMGILEVKFSDLGRQAWTLELEGPIPTLVVNRRLDVNKEYVRSDEAFFSLVYPAVVREILTRAVVIEDDQDWDSDSDDWQSLWIGFVRALPGVDAPPRGDDQQQKITWVDGAVRAFCDAQEVCERFIQNRITEANK